LTNAAALILYSVDTSALLDGLERYYAEDVFPGIWEKVWDLVAGGRFFVSEEVWEEAQKKTGVVKAWCEKDTTGNLIVRTDGTITREVKSILAGTPKMVMNMKGRNRADPFVVAVARLRGATVVTGEGSDGTEGRPKIPYVCSKLAVPCKRFTELIRGEGWRF
jgi:Domain of unknown function (DUF4411)